MSDIEKRPIIFDNDYLHRTTTISSKTPLKKSAFTRVTISSSSTSSPTSVVIDSTSISSSGSNSSSKSSSNHTIHLTKAMIQARLKDFVKQQTNTKALFDSKLERAMMDIQDHTTLIEELQKELQMAKAQKKEFQQTMKTIQSQRQLEDERMHVQKLRLEIFQCCCSYDGEDPSTNNNNNPSNETTRETMNQIVQKFQNEDDEGAIFLSLSYQELVLIKRRLEGLLEMFQKAETAARSKKLEIRKQAAIMKQDVISKYVVLYQFQQII